MIFKKQTIRGFWLLFWYQSAKPDAIAAMFDHLAPLIAAGTISTPVAATYRLEQVKDAITHAGQSGGKVLDIACTTDRPRGSTEGQTRRDRLPPRFCWRRHKRASNARR